MFIDFSKLISPKWLFDPVPPANFFLFWPLFGLFIGLIICAILIYLYFTFIRKEPPFHRLKSYLLNLFLSCGILGLVYLGFRNQNIPYFSSRIIVSIILLSFFVLFILIMIFTLTKLKKDIANYRKKKELDKYLPGRKNG